MSFLYIKYICEDEEEKEKLISIYKKNEKLYKNQMQEKVDFKDILENNKKQKILNKKAGEDTKDLIIEKPSIVRRIVLKIKKFAKRILNKI